MCGVYATLCLAVQCFDPRPFPEFCRRMNGIARRRRSPAAGQSGHTHTHTHRADDCGTWVEDSRANGRSLGQVAPSVEFRPPIGHANSKTHLVRPRPNTLHIRPDSLVCMPGRADIDRTCAGPPRSASPQNCTPEELILETAVAFRWRPISIACRCSSGWYGGRIVF